jgi:DNA-binding transcriptional ArsR family regulator
LGTWRIRSDELAHSHFLVSPFIETVGALRMLVRRQPTPATRDWYGEHVDEYRAHIASNPFLVALVDALFRPRWIADFLTPPPDPADRSFFDALRRVREADPDWVGAVIRDGSGHLPPALAGDGVAERTADLLEWIWTRTVSSEWSRRKLILEADVLSRTRQLAVGGWSAALEGLRPGMRWLGEGELRINAYNSPPRDLAGAQLYFVPFTGQRGWVSWDQQGRHAIIYPCAGGLVEIDRVRSPVALTRLMGRNRAFLLTLLDQPRTTSQLVAMTGLSLGSVGGHLAVLRDAGLITRRRVGHSVAYRLTPIGAQLTRRDQSGGIQREEPPVAPAWLHERSIL